MHWKREWDLTWCADRECVLWGACNRHAGGSSWPHQAVSTNSKRHLWGFWRCGWERCNQDTCVGWHSSPTHQLCHQLRQIFVWVCVLHCLYFSYAWQLSVCCFNTTLSSSLHHYRYQSNSHTEIGDLDGVDL